MSIYVIVLHISIGSRTFCKHFHGKTTLTYLKNITNCVKKNNLLKLQKNLHVHLHDRTIFRSSTDAWCHHQLSWPV